MKLYRYITVITLSYVLIAGLRLNPRPSGYPGKTGQLVDLGQDGIYNRGDRADKLLSSQL